MAAWQPKALDELASTLTMWLPLPSPQVNSTAGATFTLKDDGTWIVGGTNGKEHTYIVTTTLAQSTTLSALLLDFQPDDALQNKSLGRAFNGDFVLSRIEAQVTAAGTKKPAALKFAKAEATYSQERYDIQNVIGKDRFKGWAVDGPTNRSPKKAMFVLDSPVTLPAGSKLIVKLDINQHNMGRFMFSYSSLGGAAGENRRRVCGGGHRGHLEDTSRQAQREAKGRFGEVFPLLCARTFETGRCPARGRAPRRGVI